MYEDHQIPKGSSKRKEEEQRRNEVHSPISENRGRTTRNDARLVERKAGDGVVLACRHHNDLEHEQAQDRMPHEYIVRIERSHCKVSESGNTL